MGTEHKVWLKPGLKKCDEPDVTLPLEQEAMTERSRMHRILLEGFLFDPPIHRADRWNALVHGTTL